MTPNDHQPVSQAKTSRSALVLVLIVVILLAIGGYLILKPQPNKTPTAVAPAAISPASVTITSSGFSPATVSVKAGQAVVWTNTDSVPHGVASGASTAKLYSFSSKQD